MFKLVLEKAEEQEIKLPTSVGSQEKREISRNKQTNEKKRKEKKTCFIDYTKDFDYVDHSKMWKILKGMGIPDHLTCLLSNLYAGQEATVRTEVCF